MKNIDNTYFLDEYIQLYLSDGEEIFNFEYCEGDEFFKNKAIKRPIRRIGAQKLDKQYFDLESAYGYGGIHTNSKSQDFLDRAINDYKLYCNSNSVIAEFIRFRPFFQNKYIESSLFDFYSEDRPIVVKCLNSDVLQSYKPRVRTYIRKYIGLSNFSESFDVELFFSMYFATMKKNEAEKFYFFSKEYFYDLLKIESVKLYCQSVNGVPVSMAFLIIDKESSYYHLVANTPRAYEIGANYALVHNLFELTKQLGRKFCVLGGGNTPEKENKLLQFKQKFTKKLYPFHIGGIIYDKVTYNSFCELWERQNSSKVKYFLKYRLDVES